MNVKIRLNPKISRQLIKCWSTWQAGACQKRSQFFFPLSFSLSTRGFTHSGGARRIKASPTGWPDKPDQKEHTDRRERFICFAWGVRVKKKKKKMRIQLPPLLTLSLPPKTHRDSHIRGLEQRCTWSTALLRLAQLTALCSLGLSLHHPGSCPGLSASQWLALCPDCQGCRRRR